MATNTRICSGLYIFLDKRSLGGDVSFGCPHLLSCNVSGCCLNIAKSIVHTILNWFNKQQHHFN